MSSYSGDRFTRQFRAEYMDSKYCVQPLSSDVYTKWGQDNATQHEIEVLQSHQILLTTVIPDFAKYLQSNHMKYQFQAGAKVSSYVCMSCRVMSFYII